jgi:hypothetical protein
MTVDDDFLSRWSRRKRAAEEAEMTQPATKEPPPQGGLPVAGRHDDRSKSAEAAFDITQLPPLDSITAISDVRDFLRAGVPADLTRAALRRAWSADPAIRDFIGLAENAWDFTDPNAMPGFGPLEATDDVRQMVEQIMSRVGDALPRPPDAVIEARPQSAESSELPAFDTAAPRDKSSEESDIVGRAAEHGDSEVVVPQDDSQVDIATQHSDGKPRAETAKLTKILRRTHGGALPH